MAISQDERNAISQFERQHALNRRRRKRSRVAMSEKGGMERRAKAHLITVEGL